MAGLCYSFDEPDIIDNIQLNLESTDLVTIKVFAINYNLFRIDPNLAYQENIYGRSEENKKRYIEKRLTYVRQIQRNIVNLIHGQIRTYCLSYRDLMDLTEILIDNNCVLIKFENPGGRSRVGKADFEEQGRSRVGKENTYKNKKRLNLTITKQSNSDIYQLFNLELIQELLKQF